MLNAATAATALTVAAQPTAAPSMKVAANLRSYNGPLGRFLEKQAEVKAKAEAEAQQAAILEQCRRNIMHLMQGVVFSPEERLRANDSVYQCFDFDRLQRWYKNVCRVHNEREDALWLAFEDGTCTFLSVQR